MTGRATATEQVAYRMGYENGQAEGRAEGYDQGWLDSEEQHEAIADRYVAWLEDRNDKLTARVAELEKQLSATTVRRAA